MCRRAVAQAALDARNARFRSTVTKSVTEEEGEDAWDRQRSAASERLEQAEKVAERIVSKNIPEAVQKVHLPTTVYCSSISQGFHGVDRVVSGRCPSMCLKLAAMQQLPLIRPVHHGMPHVASTTEP